MRKELNKLEVTTKAYREYLEGRLRQIEHLEKLFIEENEEGSYFTFSPDCFPDKMANLLELCRQKDYIMKELYKIDRESPKVQVKIGDKIVSA